jgi:aminomethyltransferase
VNIPGLVHDFGDIDAEVEACRAGAALFDFSFMSSGRVSGPGAIAAVQSLTPRPLINLRPGRLLYAVRVDNDGFARADLTIWQIRPDSFDVFSGRGGDIAALAGARDRSAETCVLSIQGPYCLAALSRVSDPQVVARLDYFEHAATNIAGVECRVGRLGYTGERGFEIIAPAADKRRLWDALAAEARCAGFAAADVLRIEAGFVLFANEFIPGVTPMEAGLSRFCPPSPHRPRVELAAFTAKSRERPVLFSPGSGLFFPPAEGEIAVTSAAWSARSRAVVGLGYVCAGTTHQAFIDRAGRFAEIRRARMPIVDPEKRRVRGGWRTADFLPCPS